MPLVTALHQARRSDHRIPGELVARLRRSRGSLVIAGATLAGQAGGGLYWIVPSVLSAIIFGPINVWVLLVEILR